MASDKLNQLFGIEEIKAQQQEVINIINETVTAIAEASKKMRLTEMLSSDNANLSKAVESIKQATAAINEQKAATDKLLAAKKQQQDLENAAAIIGSGKYRKEAEDVNVLVQVSAALNTERQRMAALAGQEASNAQKLLGTYDQLKKQYLDASNNARQLAASQVLAGKSVNDFNDQTKSAIAYAQDMNGKLGVVEKSVSNYQNRINACNNVVSKFNGLLSELPRLSDSSRPHLKTLASAIEGISTKLVTGKVEEAKTNAQELVSVFTDAAKASASVIDSIEHVHATGAKRAKEAFREQSEEVEQNRKQQIEGLKYLSLSEQEKADKTAEINARAAAQEARLQTEKKKQAAKEVQFEREAAIAKAVLNLYLGVAKEIGSKGVIGIATGAAIFAFIGSLVAAMTSVKTPALYAKGGVHKGGAAVAGEAGAELVQEPGKRPYILEQATYYPDAPRGTVFTPLKNIQAQDSWLTTAMAPQAFSRAIQTQTIIHKPVTTTTVIVDRDGIRQISRQGAWTANRILNKISK